jgi:hypothetical protein
VGGTLSFAPGETSKVIEVPVLGNLTVEGTRQFALHFSSASNATLPSSAATITILDNESPPPQTPVGLVTVPDRTGLFEVQGPSGTAVGIHFEYSGRDASYRNELGIFLVDDAQGRVGSLLPGEPGYLQAALADGRRFTLFDSGAAPGAVTTLALAAGQRFGSYLIQNASFQQWQARNSGNGLGGPLVLLSLAVNPDGFDHRRSQSLGQNTWQVRWEDLTGGGDGDFNDAVLTINPTRELPQAQPVSPQSEVFQLPGRSGEQVQMRFQWASRETRFNNELGVYLVDDALGRIGSLLPGQAGYLSAALARRQVRFQSGERGGAAARILDFDGGGYLAYYLIVDASYAQWQAAGSPESGVRLSQAEANAGRRRSTRQEWLPDMTGMLLSWEDLSDDDFNDALLIASVFRVLAR